MSQSQTSLNGWDGHLRLSDGSNVDFVPIKRSVNSEDSYLDCV